MDTRPTSSSGYSHTAPLPNPYLYAYPESTPHQTAVYDASSSTQGVSPSAISKDASNSVSLTSPHSVVSEESASSSMRSHSGRTVVSGRSIANSTSPRPLRSTSLVKGQDAPPLPATAGKTLSNVPDDELRTTRLVEGRPQDFGSLSRDASGSGGDNPEYMESNPPPDYSQATQPYRGVTR
ncbi:hypothetical protein L218DRAFT_522039 [Marasmius fiardii PR-910]|nr:hypothetical protein L218DRAFT_522039 [Marasmius fiardii PR-910]